jgi:hypothetical protein
MAATLQTLVVGHPEVDFVFNHTTRRGTAALGCDRMHFDTREVRQAC